MCISLSLSLSLFYHPYIFLLLLVLVVHQDLEVLGDPVWKKDITQQWFIQYHTIRTSTRSLTSYTLKFCLLTHRMSIWSTSSYTSLVSRRSRRAIRSNPPGGSCSARISRKATRPWWAWITYWPSVSLWSCRSFQSRRTTATLYGQAGACEQKLMIKS